MTRATQDEITQMAREVTASLYNVPSTRADIMSGKCDEDCDNRAARAAILATLAKYAPDKLPADPDEELAEHLVNAHCGPLGFMTPPEAARLRSLALYVIKHMREKQA